MSVLAPGKSHGGFRAAGSHNEIACRADPLGIIRDCRLRRSANRQPREVSAIKAGASPYFTTKMEKSHKQAQFDARPADQAPICSGLLIGMTSFSSKWILSHSTWYKNPRSRHLVSSTTFLQPWNGSGSTEFLSRWTTDLFPHPHVFDELGGWGVVSAGSRALRSRSTFSIVSCGHTGVCTSES